MKKKKVVRVLFALVLLSIPLLAVDCCRSQFEGDSKLMLSIEDTSNFNFTALDSFQLEVLNAPNPSAGNLDPQRIIGRFKNFYLNPKDTISKAKITYKGVSDTLTVLYNTMDMYYDNCRKMYGVRTSLNYIAHTSHWLGNADGKLQIVLPYIAASSRFTNFTNFIQLYGKK